MENFYYTYGYDGHPFVGGWTMVRADSREEADEAFRAVHPDKHRGFLNCAFVYTEEEFCRTSMFSAGNIGHGCREIISAQVGGGVQCSELTSTP